MKKKIPAAATAMPKTTPPTVPPAIAPPLGPLSLLEAAEVAGPEVVVEACVLRVLDLWV